MINSNFLVEQLEKRKIYLIKFNVGEGDFEKECEMMDVQINGFHCVKMLDNNRVVTVHTSQILKEVKK